MTSINVRHPEQSKIVILSDDFNNTFTMKSLILAQDER